MALQYIKVENESNAKRAIALLMQDGINISVTDYATQQFYNEEAASRVHQWLEMNLDSIEDKSIDWDAFIEEETPNLARRFFNDDNIICSEALSEITDLFIADTANKYSGGVENV